MPLPVISGVRRCSIIGRMGPQQIVNVIHVAGGSTDGDVADDVGAAWTAVLGTHGVISSDYEAVSIDVLALDGTSATTSWVPTGWTLAGGNVGASVPASVALIGTLRTALGGRSRRGRIYIAGIPASAIDSTATQWNSSAMSDFQDITDALLTNLGPGPNGSELVVASYALASAASVVSTVARQYLGTQRRRVN